MVDPIGLEPTTSAMSRQRSSQLSYGSKLLLFFSDKPYKRISDRRPSDYEAKPTNIYRPRPGSSIGKVRVRQIGAVKTEKAMRKVMTKLFTMLEGAFTPKGKMSKNVKVKKNYKI